MEKFTKKILKYRILVLGIFGLLIGLSVVGNMNVNVNSNIMDYLPQDIESIEGAKIIQEEFNDTNTINLLVRTSDETLRVEVKTSVESHKWIEEASEVAKNDDAILYSLSLTNDVTTDNIKELATDLNKILADKNIKGGVASGSMSTTTDVDTGPMMMATFGVIILVLLLFSKSFFDVVIILMTLGVAIVINMGSNYFLGSVSSMTMSAASLIQLAVSIDYALFILNNYRQAVDKGMQLDQALPYAVKKSAKSVMAGAITTVAGFVALMFMQLELGKDMGIVLAKGIIISIITALILVPTLIKVFNKAMKKLEHRNLIPDITFFGKFVSKAKSSTVVILLLAMTVGAYIVQDKIIFLYGEPAMGETEEYIQDNFKEDISMVVVYENKDSAKVFEFANKVTTDMKDQLIDGTDTNGPVTSYELVIYSVTKNVTDLVYGCKDATDAATDAYCNGLVYGFGFGTDTIQMIVGNNNTVILDTIIDGTIEGMSTQISPMFVGKTHSRMIVNFKNNGNGETPERFALVESLRKITNDVFGDSAKVVGRDAMITDMRTLNNQDYIVVTIISIAAVALVIALAFKSISIPLLLIIVIQGAIWANIALSSLTGDTLVFMGVIIISSIQLGATIDYSILLTEKYEHNRLHEGMNKKDAIFDAAKNSAKSILTSGIALTLAGFVMFALQSGTVAQLGLLLGRGALVSLLISLVAIPHVLYLFDKVIWKTTFVKKDHLK